MDAGSLSLFLAFFARFAPSEASSDLSQDRRLCAKNFAKMFKLQGPEGGASARPQSQAAQSLMNGDVRSACFRCLSEGGSGFPSAMLNSIVRLLPDANIKAAHFELVVRIRVVMHWKRILSYQRARSARST